jgi:hypothetical protein
MPRQNKEKQNKKKKREKKKAQEPRYVYTNHYICFKIGVRVSDCDPYFRD